MLALLKNQEGKADSKTPLIITIIIIGIVGFLAYKFVPVKWKYVEFTDELQELLNINYAKEYKEVARDGFNEYTMREAVLALAKKHKIPLPDPERQMSVKWPEKRLFTVTLDYEEKIELPIYGEYVWKFHVYMEQDPHSGKAI